MQESHLEYLNKGIKEVEVGPDKTRFGGLSWAHGISWVEVSE